MINIAITKLSSRGQIVIPSEMRDNVSEGEKPVTIKNGERLILKKVSDLGKNFGEDIAFARNLFLDLLTNFLKNWKMLEVEHESNFKKIHRIKNKSIKE